MNEKFVRMSREEYFAKFSKLYEPKEVERMYNHYSELAGILEGIIKENPDVNLRSVIPQLIEE